jgi:hypothetical protein
MRVEVGKRPALKHPSEDASLCYHKHNPRFPKYLQIS